MKQVIIEANCKHREDEIEEYFQKHIEDLEEKLNKAESIRRQSKENSHRVGTHYQSISREVLLNINITITNYKHSSM